MQIGLILDHFLILLGLQLDLFFLLLEALLELSHLLLIFDLYDFLDDIADNTFLFVQCLNIATLIEKCELLLQFRDFVLVFSEQGIFWIFVDLWLVLDVFGAICVSERVHCLVVVVVSWSDVGDHERLRVAAQGVLQQSGQLRVSIGYIRVLGVGEGGDNVTER